MSICVGAWVASYRDSARQHGFRTELVTYYSFDNLFVLTASFSHLDGHIVLAARSSHRVIPAASFPPFAKHRYIYINSAFVSCLLLPSIKSYDATLVATQSGPEFDGFLSRFMLLVTDCSGVKEVHVLRSGEYQTSHNERIEIDVVSGIYLISVFCEKSINNQSDTRHEPIGSVSFGDLSNIPT